MSGQRYATILLFGSPGAGKGTQGKILAELPGFFHVSSGSIFRSLDPQSEESKRISEYTSRGELAPDSLAIEIWEAWLEAQVAEGRYKPHEQILVLDGIPRNVEQCDLTERTIDVKLLLHLASGDQQTMIDRIKRRAELEGRTDDSSEDIIQRRFEVYRVESTPVLDHYPEDIVAEIDPMGTAAEVFARILAQIIPVQNAFLQAPAG